MKIAHIGNIANNAYLAAYAERELGLDSYVFDVNLNDSKSMPGWEWSESIEEANLYVNPEWYFRGTWRKIIKIFPHFESLKVRRNGKIHNIKRILPVFVSDYLSNNVRYFFRAISTTRVLEEFLNNFDILVFYGPYTSLIARLNFSPPIISVEHGTLDNFCRGKYLYCKDSLKGYRKSDKVVLTNQEGYFAALDFGISEDKLVKSCHPNLPFSSFRIDDFQYTSKKKEDNFTFLAPARHSYGSQIESGKGILRIIEALSTLRASGVKFKVIFIEHGSDVQLTKDFIRKLNLVESVEWRPFLTRKQLKLLMLQVDLVIDQAESSSYGTITADSLLLGVPCLTLHSCSLDICHFGSCSPVHQINPVNDFSQGLARFVNLSQLGNLNSAEIRNWANIHISSAKSLNNLLKIYSTFTT